jgi:U3 small nucleolar RNA-associated protein 21
LDTKAREVLGSIELLEEARVSALIHPATYLNKIIIGYENGSMELWNFRRKSLVHAFTCHIQFFETQRQQKQKDIFGN